MVQWCRSVHNYFQINLAPMLATTAKTCRIRSRYVMLLLGGLQVSTCVRSSAACRSDTVLEKRFCCKV